jgi:hypothetical protein
MSISVCARAFGRKVVFCLFKDDSADPWLWNRLHLRLKANEMYVCTYVYFSFVCMEFLGSAFTMTESRHDITITMMIWLLHSFWALQEHSDSKIVKNI